MGNLAVNYREDGPLPKPTLGTIPFREWFPWSHLVPHWEQRLTWMDKCAPKLWVQLGASSKWWKCLVQTARQSSGTAQVSIPSVRQPHDTWMEVSILWHPSTPYTSHMGVGKGCLERSSKPRSHSCDQGESEDQQPPPSTYPSTHPALPPLTIHPLPLSSSLHSPSWLLSSLHASICLPPSFPPPTPPSPFPHSLPPSLLLCHCRLSQAGASGYSKASNTAGF